MRLMRKDVILRLILPLMMILVIMSGITLIYIEEQDDVDRGTADFDLSYRFYLENQGPHNLTGLNLRLALLKSWEPVQTLNERQVSMMGNRTITDEYDNEFEWYEYDRFYIGQTLDITVSVNLTVNLLDYSGYDFGEVTYDTDSDNYRLYTAFDPLADTTDIRIQSLADELTKNSESFKNTLFNLYNFTSSFLDYKLLSRTRGASFAVSNGYGDCDEYQNLFIALSRSKGIPAVGHTAWFTDFETGLVTTDDGTAAHAYPMFYVQDLGLLPVDPTRGKDAIFDNWLKTDHRTITMTRGPDHPYRLLNYKWIPQEGLSEPSIFSNYTITIENLDVKYTSRIRVIVLATIVIIPVIFVSGNVVVSKWDLQRKKEKLQRILSPTLLQ